jgi:hypothetical protein
MIIDQIWFWAIFGFALGAKAGIWSESKRWRQNARDYKRIESKGELFKVIPDRLYSDDLFHKCLGESD